MLYDHTPGTLLPGGIVCDHSLPMTGDGEYRLSPEVAARLAYDAAPSVDMAVAFPGIWNRVRRL